MPISDYDRVLDEGYLIRDEMNNAEVLLGNLLGMELFPESLVQLPDEFFNKEVKAIPAGKPYGQILYSDDTTVEEKLQNIGIGHYISIYNNGVDKRIHIYDSLNMMELNEMQKKFIKNLYPDATPEHYTFHRVTQQRDGTSCGIHAIANLEIAIRGEDPSDYVLDSEEQLRLHLFHAFEVKRLTPFPATRKKKAVHQKDQGALKQEKTAELPKEMLGSTCHIENIVSS